MDGFCAKFFAKSIGGNCNLLAFAVWEIYNIVSGGVRRRFYLTFEIKHSPYHPILKVSIPPYSMFLLHQNSYNKTNGAKSTLNIGPTFVK